MNSTSIPDFKICMGVLPSSTSDSQALAVKQIIAERNVISPDINIVAEAAPVAYGEFSFQYNVYSFSGFGTDFC